MRSWRRRVNLLLIIILLFVLVFLFVLVAYFNVHYSSLLRTEDENTLTLWMNNCEQRLNAVHDQVYEILLTVYKNTATAYGGGPLPVSVSVQCQDMMQNLLQVSSDADCYFLTDAETGQCLISAKRALKYTRTLLLKEYIHSLDSGLAGSISDRHWEICAIGGETFFLCFLRTGKYLAGALCPAGIFSDIGNVNMFTDVSSLLLAVPEGSTWSVNGEDLSGQVRIREGRLVADTRGNVASFDFPMLKCRAILISKSVGFLNSRWISIVLLIVMGLILSLLMRVTFLILRKVARPTRELLYAQEKIGAGHLDYRITADPGSSEFETLYHSFNAMADQIRRLETETYENLQKEQENRFRMVRAQIRPHFYLNSITVIQNMTYQNRLEDIRSYIQALAKHIRYMLNIQSPSIPVSAELSHIRNYITMQDIRFPGSVHASYHVDEQVSEVEIPFLILFTVVENSFKHAMNLYSPLELNIFCEAYREEGFEGIRLAVEDNGDGFSAEALDHFSGPMPEEMPTKDHLGLSNVRYTLRYVYRRDRLLRLSNLEHGARTEILIPTEGKNA